MSKTDNKNVTKRQSSLFFIRMRIHLTMNVLECIQKSS